jgi:HSP20 family protein
MNRLFEETVARGTVREEAKSGQWSPAVDILEAEGEIILRAELPGVDLNAIDIQIKDNVLTLRGERTFENQVKKEHYYRIERSYGTFVRSFKLPMRGPGAARPITVEVT